MPNAIIPLKIHPGQRNFWLQLKRGCPLLIVCIVSLVAWTAPIRAQELRWNSDYSRCIYSLDKRDSDGPEFFEVTVGAQKNRAKRRIDIDEIAKAISGFAKASSVTKMQSAEHKPPRIVRIEYASTDGQWLVSSNRSSWIWDIDQKQILGLVTPDSTGSGGQFFYPPRRSSASDERIDIVFENALDEEIELTWVGFDGSHRSYGKVAAGATSSMSTFEGHVWLLKGSSGKHLGCYAAKRRDHVLISEDLIRNSKSQAERRDAESARSNWRNRNRNRASQDADARTHEVFVRDHDIWTAEHGDGSAGERRLTMDATEENSFLNGRSRRDSSGTSADRSSDRGKADVRWSPDNKYLLATQTARVEKREVVFVESSPKDQLQPSTQSYTYPKPGDPLDKRTLRLFEIDEGREIAIDHQLFSNPYWNRFVDWSPTGDRFYLHYNERGHQVRRLVEVSTETGAARTVAENLSTTFLEHSNPAKTFCQILPDEQLLWASERSGWNHLYRYDIPSGEVLNAVTEGEWNIKRIHTVDTEKRCVWFFAVGGMPDQDPYHEHFCRVNFDGTDFAVLTEGDGTHSISFEADQRYFEDTYSRVDLAPVTELRSSSDGKLICELKREDASELFGDRQLPERFTAFGRDGVTDIWGIIHFPKDFNPQRQYPVVENIYAGPHDHHVPKSFRRRYRTQQRIADAGMIVVQIDGMGTAWRSKAFHDVCYKNLRDAGFPDRIAWMKAAAKKFPQMDLSRVGIWGGSAGGQNAMAALLWHNEFYDVAVADCGCHDNRMDKMWWNEQWMGYPVDESYENSSNVANAHLLKGHLMLTVGEADRNVDPASTTQVVDALIRADKDFEFVLIPGGGHGSGETPWAARKRLNFLRTHLNADEELLIRGNSNKDN